MKRTALIFLIIALCLSFAGCGGADTLKMSASEVAEGVVYNESMVGVSGTLNKYFRPKVVFDNNDSNKIKYLTNNMYTDTTPDIDINIIEGAYYEAFVDLNGTEYARAVVTAVQFDSSASAEAAFQSIKDNLNLKSNEDGTCDLEYGQVSIRKNIIFVVAAYENNTVYELTRVFNNKNYIY